jgi:triacylglycerol lipase
MNDVVVLIHGLGRTPLSMSAVWLAARRRGYRVINWHYRSALASIEDHAKAFEREVLPRITHAPRVHFVTHSLGGIVVRQFLAAHALPNLGRVVMLAPPNGGSEVADVLQRCAIVSHCVAPVRELGTSDVSAPRSLPAANFPVGIIAGSRSHIPLFSRWMDHVPNDGVVAVEKTKLDGMSDFIVMHHTHTTLPWSRDVLAQVFCFLDDGHFTAAA